MRCAASEKHAGQHFGRFPPEEEWVESVGSAEFCHELIQPRRLKDETSQDSLGQKWMKMNDALYGVYILASHGAGSDLHSSWWSPSLPVSQCQSHRWNGSRSMVLWVVGAHHMLRKIGKAHRGFLSGSLRGKFKFETYSLQCEWRLSMAGSGDSFKLCAAAESPLLIFVALHEVWMQSNRSNCCLRFHRSLTSGLLTAKCSKDHEFDEFVPWCKADRIVIVWVAFFFCPGTRLWSHIIKFMVVPCSSRILCLKGLRPHTPTFLWDVHISWPVKPPHLLTSQKEVWQSGGFYLQVFHDLWIFAHLKLRTKMLPLLLLTNLKFQVATCHCWSCWRRL